MERHLPAVASLQEAVLQGDVERSAALETAVKDARTERMNATQEYREHLRLHEAQSASVAM
jgi:hypothetical protein